MKIETVKDLMKAVRVGKYADGGYPIFFIAEDGSDLSIEAIKENILEVGRAIRDRTAGKYYDKEWAIIAHEVNWENPHLYCAYTGKRIESAYAEEEL